MAWVDNVSNQLLQRGKWCWNLLTRTVTLLRKAWTSRLEIILCKNLVYCIHLMSIIPASMGWTFWPGLAGWVAALSSLFQWSQRCHCLYLTLSATLHPTNTLRTLLRYMQVLHSVPHLTVWGQHPLCTSIIYLPFASHQVLIPYLNVGATMRYTQWTLSVGIKRSTSPCQKHNDPFL